MAVRLGAILVGYSHKHRFKIWNANQHPFRHSLEDFSYTNEALPGVSSLKDSLDYILAVLYPLSQASVPTKADLPISATFVATPGSPTVITATGDKYYTGDQVKLTSTGTLPTGLSPMVVYYLRETSPNVFSLYLDKDFIVPATSSDAGVGTHSIVNLANSYRVVLDDGDGKAAAYRYEQREGDVAPLWYKVGDLDWGQDSVIAAFMDVTQDLYVYKQGKDDRDKDGLPLTGVDAGQHVYGGASANTNLILHANRGDGTGPQTGAIVTEGEVIPYTSATFSLGAMVAKYAELWLAEAAYIDTMTISSGSITDTTGSIDFGVTDLTTGGTVAADVLDANSATIGDITIATSSITSAQPDISFGANNLTTTGEVEAFALTAKNGAAFTTISTGADRTLIDSSFDRIDVLGADVEGVNKLTSTSVETGLLGVDDLTLDTNVISSTTDINLTPAATFKNKLNADTDITGDLLVTGSVTADSLTDGKTILNGTNISSTDGFVDVDPTKVLRTGDIEAVDVKATTLTSPTGVSELVEDIVDFPFTGANEGDTVVYTMGHWVPTPFGGGGGATDHGMLTGLADDDHLQYALLAGRMGGQVLTGGTQPTDTLELRSNTANNGTQLKVREGVSPTSTATFVAGAWTGASLGDTLFYFNHLYSKGEHFGLRAENVATLPAANVANRGRIVYLVPAQALYVDAGGTWVTSGGGGTVSMSSSGGGEDSSGMLSQKYAEGSGAHIVKFNHYTDISSYPQNIALYLSGLHHETSLGLINYVAVNGTNAIGDLTTQATGTPSAVPSLDQFSSLLHWSSEGTYLSFEKLGTGDGVTTSFPYTGALASDAHIIVYLNGDKQQKALYSISGGNAVFATAPAPGQTVTVHKILGSGVLTPFHETVIVTGGLATLTYRATDKHSVVVFKNGLIQPVNSYLLRNLTLEFKTPVAVGSIVEVLYFY